jgi:hypothetical protein
MSVQTREAKVFAALLVSMTVGTMVLMALGGSPPLAGAFCLSSYYHLDPIEKVIAARAVRSANRWSRIEVYYSGTKTGNIEQLALLSGLTSPEDINCHFVICNGLGAADGQIQPTEKWQRQWLIIPDRAGDYSGQTIRICIISDGKTTLPTDFQIKRGEALVEELRRKFNIQLESIHYPNGW